MNQYLKFDVILIYIAVIGLMFGGLIMAQQIGIYGAQGSMNVAKWIGRSARGTAGRWVARGMPLTSINRLRRKQAKAISQGKFNKAKRLGKRIKFGQAKRKIVGAALSPTSWQRMWAARSARAQAQSFDHMAGGGYLDDAITSATEYLRHPKNKEQRRKSYEAQQMKARAVDKQQSEYAKNIKNDDEF